MEGITYLQSLRQGLHTALESDSRTFLLGEDILDPYGGAFKVTAGLQAKFPTRVLTTPISEAAIVGVSTGMAMRGLLPVVEIMFGDFLTLCMDQIVNHATKFHAMFDGKVTVSSVIRTPVGAGRGYGPTHSQSIEKLFLGVPYLRVVAPSHTHDPGLLLLHAILKDPGVVLFIEHKLLYSASLLRDDAVLSIREVQEHDGYPTTFVRNFAQGIPDVTLVTYGGMSRVCVPVLQELAAEEIRILAVFPSCLKPLPVETLVKAATESGRVVIAEEGTQGYNWGSEVSALLNERCWRRMATPIRRLATLDSVLPAARQMEDEVILTRDKIRSAILESL